MGVTWGWRDALTRAPVEEVTLASDEATAGRALTIDGETRAEPRRGGTRRGDDALASLRATGAERFRILSTIPAFDAEKWERGTIPPDAEELADLEEFLREREETRRRSLEAERQRFDEPEQ
jgi:hypothetical protein